MSTLPQPFSVCVYCGSRDGMLPAYAAAAQALGGAIGARGWQLVYGGGRVGLMGAVADATLTAGGRVVGVIPEALKKREVDHSRLHELHVVPTMHVRKQMMADRAHAFVALPGGIGTFEELFEVLTWRQLGYHDQPIGLLNVAGYYDALLGFLRHSVEHGFLSVEQLEMLRVHTDPHALLDDMADLAKSAIGPDDYTRT